MSISSESGSRLSTLWNIIKIILAIALIGLVLSKVDLAQLWTLNERMDMPWLVLSLILYISLTLVKARQYRTLISTRTSYAGVLRIVVVQNAVSNFVASSAGIASYLTLMRTEEDVKLRKGIGSFVITKIGDLISMAFFLSISAVLTWNQIVPLRGATILLLLVICLVIGVFLVTIIFRQRFVGLLARTLALLRLDRLPLAQKSLDTLQLIAEQETGNIFRLMRIGILFSFLYMVITLVWAYSNLRFFSLILPFQAVVYGSSILQLISWLPIQVFGGLGVTEVTIVYLYSLFGMPQADLALVSIGGRLLSYIQTLVLLSYLPLSAFFSRKEAAG